MRIHVVDHPLVAHKLTTLRDERTDSPTFRRLADELVSLLAYEATRDVRTDLVDIRTPVTGTTGVRLSHPIRPESSSYAISKTAGEQYVMLSGLEYLSFRLANAYGPRNVSGPLPTFYQRLSNGKACFVMDTRRDFIFIDDLADVVLRAVNGKGQPGVYHISSGRDYAIKDLFDATVQALGISPAPQVEVRPRGVDDAYTILLDPSKTNQTFDWTVSTPLEAGVLQTVAWYKRFGLTETYTHLKPVETGAQTPRSARSRPG
jgi:UDP-glucose 4-epimerase